LPHIPQKVIKKLKSTRHLSQINTTLVVVNNEFSEKTKPTDKRDIYVPGA
jgi:hypothetical protein